MHKVTAALAFGVYFFITSEGASFSELSPHIFGMVTLDYEFELHAVSLPILKLLRNGARVVFGFDNF